LESLSEVLGGAWQLGHDIARGAYSLDDLIRWGGYVVLVAIVFTETGLLIGFFLPGDSLLITAGLVAATGALDIWWLNGLLIVAAIVGDSVGYAIGFRAGPRLFTREKSLLFRPSHVERTRQFYERHGVKTIVIARFVPIVRTFAPFVAGIGRMSYPVFAAWNVSGALVWVISLTLAGYFFGEIPIVKENFETVILAIVAISVAPIGIEYLRTRRAPA